jgi:hypothetical protein
MCPKTAIRAQTKMLSYWDERTKETKKISAEDFEDKLRNILEILKKSAEKMERVGKYDLEGFEVSLALEAGILIIKATGSITLKYAKPSPK